MIFFIVWVGFGIIGALIATSKGRSGVLWFFLSLLVAIIAIPVVACLPKIDQAEKAKADGTGKTCPRCAEVVKAEARACRFCNYEFGRSPIPKAIEPQVDQKFT